MCFLWYTFLKGSLGNHSKQTPNIIFIFFILAANLHERVSKANGRLENHNVTIKKAHTNWNYIWTPPDYSIMCSRLKSSMPFKRDLALQIIPLSKQPFKTQPPIENEEVTWSPQYNLHVTRTNKRRALSLQKVESHDWFLILHIVLELCTIYFIHKFDMSFVFHFYILGLTSWIWTSVSTEGLKFESPSKWNSYEGFNLDHWFHHSRSPT